ncbi:MAG: flagellar biosynthesis anti-sigma factor FlgM [Planctomycetota bacterium]|nr:flagellar biosynthesis anti-sigma factor FlgM [Planctomycetota bacterium]
MPLSTQGPGRATGLSSDRPRSTQQEGPAIRRGADRVEFSAVATYLSKLRDLPVRQDLVDRVKAEIAAGTYDTPDKFEAALTELLGDVE